METVKSNNSQNTERKTSPKRRHVNQEKNTASLEKKNLNRDTVKKQPEKLEKSHYSKQKLQSKFSNEHSYDSATNKSSESNNYHKKENSNSDKKEHRSRSSHRQSKVLPDEVTLELNTTIHNTKDSADKTSRSDVKAKRHTSKDKTSNKDDITIIPRVGTNSSKASYNKDPARHSSRPSRREYVINYDDKNGTVSSICKVRSGSASPRRKKVTKEVVTPNFNENLKNKSSDKTALRK